MLLTGGYQGSETTRGILRIHPTSYENDTLRSLAPIDFNAPGASDRGDPVLVGLHTQKSFANPVGTWEALVKVRRPRARDFVYEVQDDDWAYVGFSRFGRETQVMLGLVDDVRRIRSVEGDGATTTTYKISGSDHGKIFAITPIWFDQLTDGALGLGAVGRILGSQVGENPSRTVEKIIAGFIRASSTFGRGYWDLPNQVPLGTKGFFDPPSPTVPVRFLDICSYFDTDFTDDPPRMAALGASLFSNFNTSVWGLAEEWADGSLCELYCDLMALYTSDVEREIDETRFATRYHGTDYCSDEFDPTNRNTYQPVPAVIFRDRPFPTRSNKTFDEADSPFFTTIRQHFVSARETPLIDVGRNGYARRNAFFVSPVMSRVFGTSAVQFARPVWKTDDIAKHGIRRLDVETNYVVPDLGNNEGVDKLAEIYRERLRDFHAPNHLWLDGQMTLPSGRPDIRIGTRLFVLGPDERVTESYYVESVEHNWTYGHMTTTLGLSHGWIGSDDDLLKELRRVWSRYMIVTGEGAQLEEVQGGDILPPVPDPIPLTGTSNTATTSTSGLDASDLEE